MRADLVTSLTALEALGPEWQPLADQRGRPLLGHAWFLSCAETLHEERDLRVVTVRDGGRLVAAAPLVAATGPGGRRLELLGMSSLHEPSGLLADSPAALQALAGAIVDLGWPLSLQRLEVDGETTAAIRRAIGRRGLVLVRPTRPALAVNVGDRSWAEYEKSLSSKITSNLPRVRKRAAKLGPVAVDVASPSEADVGPLLDTVMAVEGSGWKGRQGSALRCRDGLAAFFEHYTRRAARRGELRVARLTVGDQVAAVEMAVVAYQRWWQLKIGYEESLSAYYPGLLLTYATVRHAFEQGLAGYEFLGSAADWEERWHPDRRPYELCVAYPATLRGGTGLVADLVAVGRERLARAMRRGPEAQHG